MTVGVDWVIRIWVEVVMVYPNAREPGAAAETMSQFCLTLVIDDHVRALQATHLARPGMIAGWAQERQCAALPVGANGACQCQQQSVTFLGQLLIVDDMSSAYNQMPSACYLLHASKLARAVRLASLAVVRLMRCAASRASCQRRASNPLLPAARRRGLCRWRQRRWQCCWLGRWSRPAHAVGGGQLCQRAGRRPGRAAHLQRARLPLGGRRTCW